ncbi:unnamed protein product [Mesocestoides corti]|nr:unnamed protein product [Mesocestoides corti]
MDLIDQDIFFITHIPSSLTAADLRRIFSHYVEAGAFACFHYRHRPESEGSALIPPKMIDADVMLSLLKRHRSRKTCTCTAVIAVRREQTERLIASFFESWSTDELSSQYSPCKLYRVTCTLSDFNNLAKLIEFTPPTFMPQGNVGTPSSHFFSLIRACQLSRNIITKLKLCFSHGTHHRKYGSVPYDYSDVTLEACLDEGENVERGQSRLRIKTPISTGLTFSHPTNCDEIPEEWDRFESLHVDPYNVDRSANHSLKYESKVELKWEKGGPGLVHYTDEMFWRERESVRRDEFFDEPSSFDWDIDVRHYSDDEGLSFLGPGGPDLDTQQLAQIRDVSGEKPFLSRYAVRVMQKYGWHQGTRLGKRKQKGLLRPISADDGCISLKRSGFGFTEKRRQVLKRQNASQPTGGAYIRSIFDSPETVALRSGATHLQSHHRTNPSLQVKYREHWVSERNRLVLYSARAPRGFVGVKFQYGGLVNPT